jgi:hypothetical protein
MRRLPLLAPLGALVFTLAWLVLGVVSPGYRLFDLVIEPYSPVSQPVSGLGLGVTGPWMNAAFLGGGAMLVLGAIAARRAFLRGRPVTTGYALSALTGVGMIVDGVFTLESVLLHLVGFLLAVVLPAVGFVLLGLGLRGRELALARVLLVAGPVALALFVWFQLVFDPYAAGDNTGYAGLIQRALITVVLGTWSAIGVVAARRLRAVDNASRVETGVRTLAG